MRASRLSAKPLVLVPRVVLRVAERQGLGPLAAVRLAGWLRPMWLPGCRGAACESG